MVSAKLSGAQAAYAVLMGITSVTVVVEVISSVVDGRSVSVIVEVSKRVEMRVASIWNKKVVDVTMAVVVITDVDCAAVTVEVYGAVNVW